MSTSSKRIVGVVAASFLLAGAAACSGDTETPGEPHPVRSVIGKTPPVDIGSRPDLDRVAPYAHPLYPIFVGVQAPRALADFSRMGSAQTCPKRVDNSDPIAGIVDLSYVGSGCSFEGDPESTSDDFIWNGSLHFNGDSENVTVTYDGFSITTFVDCGGQKAEESVIKWLGNVFINASAAASPTVVYDVLLRMDFLGTNQITCEHSDTVVAYDYSVDTVGYNIFFEPPAQNVVFNGTGDMVHTDFGSWSTTATDLFHESDDNCTEALRGKLSIAASADTAVITMDGDSVCDECGTLDLNGERQADLVCGLGAL